jgi:hypothetical protein
MLTNTQTATITAIDARIVASLATLQTVLIQVGLKIKEEKWIISQEVKRGHASQKDDTIFFSHLPRLISSDTSGKILASLH